MFDPFKDFASAGYLRNVYQEKDERNIKALEHDFFMANAPDALRFIASKKIINYADFLKVHNLLFSDLYPWAGQDRLASAPDIAVSKGGLLFSHPVDAKKAVNEGLRLGQMKEKMNQRPGLVMGLFAYGHPFLDGNGRAMLIVHSELCYRSGFSIDWAKTTKDDYLDSLSDEIRRPNLGVLDKYLLQFKAPRLDRDRHLQTILSINGLSGLDDSNTVVGEISDSSIVKKYQEFENRRGYAINHDLGPESNICKKCKSIPCTCGDKSPLGVPKPGYRY